MAVRLLLLLLLLLLLVVVVVVLQCRLLGQTGGIGRRSPPTRCAQGGEDDGGSTVWARQ